MVWITSQGWSEGDSAMDEKLVLARTDKGRAELFGAEHTLRLRPRQVLFVIDAAIRVDELRGKLPACRELDDILRQLLDGGYIAPAGSSGIAAPLNGVGAARAYALEVIGALVGDRSPIHARIHDAPDRAGLLEAVATGKKVIAAVASSTRAQAFEAEVLARLDRD